MSSPSTPAVAAMRPEDLYPTPVFDPDVEPEVNKLFRMCMKFEASDLHLKVGSRR